MGAGPAGAWTAYLLAARGARVILIDGSHPREKPCGGGVTGRALALVAEATGDRLPVVTIESARFVDSATGSSACVALADEGSNNRLVVGSRRAFDGVLLSAARRAGAELVTARAMDITRDAAGWRIRTAEGVDRTARFVVGADGANSLLRRRLARAFSREQLSIATGFFAHGTTSREIVVEFSADPPGYLWSFPRPDHLAVGICAQADAGATAAVLRARAADWIRTTRLAEGARLEPYAWPIPSLSARDFEGVTLAGPGWALAGDAAGLVDPITREGIFFALRSAAIAADTFVADPEDRARAYEDRIRSELVSELTRAARFKSQFFRPRFVGLLVGALGQSPRIGRVMADLISGTQSYRGLKRRLASTLEIGIAIRAFLR